ncbi:MAG: hypothetical protein KatS3mg042_0806 [Rhodothermaceae bacterium]|nr:MAG: hypothetical protein KatS3mg042_0806 [Rhodothermaceae bacterium]
MFDGHDWMWGMHWGWWIFWLLVVLVFVVLLRRATHEAPSRDESPLDILKKRYARGELTTEEYEERKKHLIDG